MPRLLHSKKNETITDTIKMLLGYSIGQSMFVIRSKVEGVCRWLEEAISEYADARGFARASFINAGDGRHEHPSQELLDEFSFLEHKGWDTASIHLALLGDLFHGRTVHSKVDGLRLYNSVLVDLIAPPDLALPAMYEERMVSFGFTVRKFDSIEEYLSQDKVATIWYFTRLQLERMGDKVLDRSTQLRKAVTFQREFVDRLPEGTRFFHPLPRDARHPTLPFWLDHTKLNGWDQQSQNGYFTRIVLLGMLGGHFGHDFTVQVPTEIKYQRRLSADFIIEETDEKDSGVNSISERVGLVPLDTGIVIDRLGRGQAPGKIWGLMHLVRSILGLSSMMGGQGVYHPNQDRDQVAGFISVPDFDIAGWDRPMLKKLAAMAPGSSLKVIEQGKVVKEFKLEVPPRIYNFRDISCKNSACVSNPSNGQQEVPPYFLRSETCNLVRADQAQNDFFTWAFCCKYCETLHKFWQIWDYKQYDASSFAL